MIKNNGKYNEGNFKTYKSNGLTDQGCDYCYTRGGMSGNTGPVTPSTVDEITEKDFQKFQPDIVRIGKRTECGHFLYEHQLLDILELCKEYSSSAILITKMLQYKEDIAQALRQSNSVAQFSVGFDRFEKGPVSQGFTNAWRIKQAERYHKIQH